MKNKTKQREPAKISYFFGEGYRDLGRTIQVAWRKNGRKIAESAENLRDSWGDTNVYCAICLTVFNLAILISSAIFGSLFTAAFTIVHIVLLAIFMSLVYLGFVLLRFVDTMFCLLNGLRTNCYNPACERKFTLPIYICPRCKELHYKLVPSKYGIFKRTCECGHKLPTTFINGRQKLDSLCPHCKQPALKGMHKSLLIPVVGGANAGKTCFISMAIDQISKKAPALKLSYQYQNVQGDEFSNNMNRMNRGLCPQKTNDLAFKYYNFYLTPKGHQIQNLISVCDIAGEVFLNQDLMAKQQGYRFADALVVVIDPLSITEFRAELQKAMSEKDYAKLSGSTQSMSDVLSGLVNTMESLYHSKATDTIKTSVVIVFTKCDIPGLDEKIGRKALTEYMNANKDANICMASNALSERFLLDYGESNFLNTVKSKFKEVQFFACSALGHNNEGKQFTPYNVELPLFWIIDKMNNTVDLSSIFKRKN